jgi:hypothetical protein
LITLEIFRGYPMARLTVPAVIAAIAASIAPTGSASAQSMTPQQIAELLNTLGTPLAQPIGGSAHVLTGGSVGEGINYVATVGDRAGDITSQIADTSVHTSQILSSADNSLPNLIGASFDALHAINKGPGDTYIAGKASYATIACGYDNIDNSLAGMICGDHNRAYTAATHPMIFGNLSYVANGDSNMLFGDANYISGSGTPHDNAIFGGLQNYITGGSALSVIVGGQGNHVSTGNGNQAVLGGVVNSITALGDGNAIVGGYKNSIGSHTTYGTIVGGTNNQIATMSTGSIVLGGVENAVGGNAIAAAVGGESSSSSFSYGLTFGNGAKAPGLGALTFTGRNHSQPGDEENVSLHMGVEQRGAAVGYMSLYGTYNFVQVPPSTSYVGRAYVSGRQNTVSGGGSCSFVGDFDLATDASGVLTVQQSWKTLRNGAQCTLPQFDVSAPPNLMLDVSGSAASGTIGWAARIDMVTNTY